MRCALPNCMYCTDQGSGCATCDTGFFLDASARCQKCGEHCAECTQQDNCLRCSFGHFIQNNSTVPVVQCVSSCSDEHEFDVAAQQCSYKNARSKSGRGAGTDGGVTQKAEASSQLGLASLPVFLTPHKLGKKQQKF